MGGFLFCVRNIRDTLSRIRHYMSVFVDDICQGSRVGCLILLLAWTWKVRGLLNRPPPGYQPCSKIWKYLWMVFCHLGSLWLCPSLVKGSRYFIHRLTPLVITSIILSITRLPLVRSLSISYQKWLIFLCFDIEMYLFSICHPSFGIGFGWQYMHPWCK